VLQRFLKSVLAIGLLCGGLEVAGPAEFPFVAVGFEPASAAVAQQSSQQFCLWYTEAPYREIARRIRTANRCPAPPVAPQAAIGRSCAHGGTFTYTGNDGTGWWYVSKCNPGPPGRPSGLRCVSSVSSIELSWAGVDRADAYQVSRDRGEKWIDSAGSRHSFAGLVAGTEHVLWVQAGALVNGALVWGPTAVKTCYTLPLAPVAHCGAATVSSVSWNWDPVDGATGYEYRYASGSDGVVLGASPSREPISATANSRFGLKPGAGTGFFVRAVNNAGASVEDFQRCSTLPAAGLPPVPGIPKPHCGTATASSITYRWRSVLGTGYYEVKHSGTDGNWERHDASSNIGTVLFTRTDLSADTNETLEVRAVSRTGSSQPSRKTCSTLPAPPSALSVACAASTNGTPEISMSWSYTAGARYQAALRRAGQPALHDEIHRGTKLSLTVAAKQGWIYQARVRVESPTGWTDWTDWSPQTACPISCPTVGGKICVTKGMYDGLRSSTSQIVSDNANNNKCSQKMTQESLMAVMLSIPLWELGEGKKDLAHSPMALGRSDNVVARASDLNNIKLYSHMTRTGHKRAHWNKGVGPWQLDNLQDTGAGVNTLVLNHAERADLEHGGHQTTLYFYWMHCSGGMSNVWQKAHGKWHGCKYKTGTDRSDITKNRCKETYDTLYNASSQSLNAGKIHIVEDLADTSGGIQERQCRWGESEDVMVCYLYNVGWAEGHIPGRPSPESPGTTAASLEGGDFLNAYTPVSAAFLSFTDTVTHKDNSDNHTRYAVWPAEWPESTTTMAWPQTTVSGEDSLTIMRAVPKSSDARKSPQCHIPRPQVTREDSWSDSDYADQVATAIENALSLLYQTPPNPPCFKVNKPAAAGTGPEGWFDNTIDGKDLQVRNCLSTPLPGTTFCQWTSLNSDPP